MPGRQETSDNAKECGVPGGRQHCKSSLLSIFINEALSNVLNVLNAVCSPSYLCLMQAQSGVGHV